jgi:iron uptake system component EfeO
MKLHGPVLCGVIAISLGVLPTFAATPSPPSPLDLVAPIAKYKAYVIGELDAFVTETKAFTDAVKTGDLAKAKTLYPTARAHYERIEPVAELFSDLDKAIDSRADDYEGKEQDSGFSGYHRIEYGLFAKHSTDSLAPIAAKLMADVTELQTRVKGLVFPPEKVVGGAAQLMEEVAATKISGEEDPYSHSDLYDFQANVDGAKQIYTLFRPLIEARDRSFSKKVDANFDSVDKILAKYRTPTGGFVTYEKVTTKDRNALAGPVNTLAEDLSRMRGMLGLD